MALYWVTIRINSDVGYAKRYQAFLEALQKVRQQGFWDEPTSFWLIESALEIDAFARTICTPLNPKTDMLLTRKIAFDEARYFGAVARAEVLLSFIPNAKKLG